MRYRNALFDAISGITGGRSRFSMGRLDAARKKSCWEDGECFPSNLLHEEGAVKSWQRHHAFLHYRDSLLLLHGIADLPGEEAVCVRKGELTVVHHPKTTRSANRPSSSARTCDCMDT